VLVKNKYTYIHIYKYLKYLKIYLKIDYYIQKLLPSTLRKAVLETPDISIVYFPVSSTFGPVIISW
jgi:hypothetical protein